MQLTHVVCTMTTPAPYLSAFSSGWGEKPSPGISLSTTITSSFHGKDLTSTSPANSCKNQIKPNRGLHCVGATFLYQRGRGGRWVVLPLWATKQGVSDEVYGVAISADWCNVSGCSKAEAIIVFVSIGHDKARESTKGAIYASTRLISRAKALEYQRAAASFSNMSLHATYTFAKRCRCCRADC